MIVGGKITSVEAKRNNDAEIKGLDINIAVDDVKATGENVEVYYTYAATYQEGVGSLKITGVLNAKEEPKTAKEIADTWKKDKKLPDVFAEVVLNTVNFTCGTNGTLVVRPVNLSPPMIPPRIQIAKGGAAGKQQ
jgi:hypothetical protein